MDDLEEEQDSESDTEGIQDVLPAPFLPSPPGLQVLNDTLRPGERVRPPPGLALQEPLAQSQAVDAERRVCVTVVPMFLNDAKIDIGVAGGGVGGKC